MALITNEKRHLGVAFLLLAPLSFVDPPLIAATYSYPSGGNFAKITTSTLNPFIGFI